MDWWDNNPSPHVTDFRTFFNGLLSLQYTTMVELLESIDYMVKNAPYRKFRPEVSIHSSPKLWSVQHKMFTADGVSLDITPGN